MRHIRWFLFAVPMIKIVAINSRTRQLWQTVKKEPTKQNASAQLCIAGRTMNAHPGFGNNFVHSPRVAWGTWQMHFRSLLTSSRCLLTFVAISQPAPIVSQYPCLYPLADAWFELLYICISSKKRSTHKLSRNKKKYSRSATNRGCEPQRVFLKAYLHGFRHASGRCLWIYTRMPRDVYHCQRLDVRFAAFIHLA